jgi:hypothetical protein
MFNVDYFSLLIGLFVGFLVVYAIYRPDVVIEQPTEDNIGKVTYVDEAGVCYKYKKEKVACELKPKE